MGRSCHLGPLDIRGAWWKAKARKSAAGRRPQRGLLLRESYECCPANIPLTTALPDHWLWAVSR